MPEGATVKTSKAAVGFQYCNKLFVEERKCAAYKPKYRQEYRQNKELPLLEEYYAWLNTVHPEKRTPVRSALMRLAFLQLHVLVALTPVMLWRAGKPLPTDPRRALVLASGYLLAVAALNRALHTNYLFLSAAPAGTPLQWLYARGGGYYVCALSMLCMTLFRLLADAYRRAAISGNR